MVSSPPSASGSHDVVVCAPTTVPYVRFSDRGALSWLGAATRSLCETAGLAPREIDGVAVASMTLAPDTAIGVVDHLGLRLRWLDQLTVGGASGVIALRRAVTAVAAGDAETVVCVGADTNRPGAFTDLMEHFSRFSRDAVYPYGASGPNGSFALLTDAFMRDTGVTVRDFGGLCVSQRANAVDNPLALLRDPFTLEEYLGARLIADPLRLLDCVLPCAGAEAFLVTTRDRARRLGLPVVRVLASLETYNEYSDDPVQIRGGWRPHAHALWERAGIAPDEVDLVHTYDDYPVISVMQLRDLGFIPDDDPARFLRTHSFTTHGSFPHNTSGGQLSTGQAGFAGGFLGVNEVLRQLTRRPLGLQVPDAVSGLVSGFGMIDYDRGLVATAAVLVGEGS